MATVLDIINRAFRKIGVKAEDEALTADQIAHGVDTFNDMVQGWALKGASAVSGDVIETDTFPFADEYREATVMVLASRLAPDYGAAPIDAERYERMVIASMLYVPTATIPSALLKLPSQRVR